MKNYFDIMNQWPSVEYPRPSFVTSLKGLECVHKHSWCSGKVWMLSTILEAVDKNKLNIKILKQTVSKILKQTAY